MDENKLRVHFYDPDVEYIFFAPPYKNWVLFDVQSGNFYEEWPVFREVSISLDDSSEKLAKRMPFSL